MIYGTMLSFIAACIIVLAASFWQAMDELDERKKLVTDIVSATRNFLQGFWRLPGMNWIHRRIFPSADLEK
jgi:hypothetical protein